MLSFNHHLCALGATRTAAEEQEEVLGIQPEIGDAFDADPATSLPAVAEEMDVPAPYDGDPAVNAAGAPNTDGTSDRVPFNYYSA